MNFIERLRATIARRTKMLGLLKSAFLNEDNEQQLRHAQSLLRWAERLVEG